MTLQRYSRSKHIANPVGFSTAEVETRLMTARGRFYFILKELKEIIYVHVTKRPSLLTCVLHD